MNNKPETLNGGEKENTENSADILREEPSFEEHMESVHRATDEESRERQNYHAQTRESAKNTEGFIESLAFNDEIYNKIRNGEKLGKDEVFHMLKMEGYVDEVEQENVDKVLDYIGMTEGEQFDMKVGSYAYTPEGESYELPCEISFKNEDGSFTKIMATKGKERSHRTESVGRHIVVTRGPQDLNDVGYHGNVDLSPDNKLIASYIGGNPEPSLGIEK